MFEQFHPLRQCHRLTTLRHTGFSGVMTVNQFRPSVPIHGQPSFGWSVLAAMGESTVGDWQIRTGDFSNISEAAPAQASATPPACARVNTGLAWIQRKT